jgi:hypothetical protein
MDKDRFRLAANATVNQDKQYMGIGTLSERSVHAVLKRYYGNDAQSEIPIAGFVADLLTEHRAIEIQTHNVRLLRRKLEAFLALMPVTIVHPVALRHRVVRIDLATGELEKPKPLPRKGSLYEAFIELTSIRDLLNNPRLTIVVPLLIVDDIRLKQPPKRGSKLVDRVPHELVDEIVFSCKEDYRQFIPPALISPFTSETFAKEAGIHRRLAQAFLLVADELDIVERIGKTGNAWLYQTK